MTNQDPLLVGLTGDDKAANRDPQPANRNEAAIPDDVEVDTAERLMRRLHGESGATEPFLEPQPRVVEATLETKVRPSIDIPSGAITSPGGSPFTDWDSAKYKSDQMHAQTGDEFVVCALSPSHFVVLGRASSAPAPSSARSSRETPPELAYRDIPIDQLKIEDFPPEHPVHNCGLKRYKRYMKKGFKFKPAYRAMWPLLTVAALGAFVYFFPVIAITQLPQDVINNILSSISAEQFGMGVSYTGAALGAFALAKVLIQRHSHRYMLQDSFAKYEFGIVKRESSKIAYGNISNYEVKQSFLGRLLNYGDMELASPGTSDSEIKMNSVFAPRLLEVVLEGKIDEARSLRR